MNMKNTAIGNAVFAALLVWSMGVFGQASTQTNTQTNTNTQTPPPEAVSALNLPAVPLPPALPIIDPAKELKGSLLIEALRKGGFVLYMRHAETGIVTEKCEQSNLSAIGEETARKVGMAMRELNIPVGAVRSSQACRTADTARLLGLGAVEITEDLNPVAPRPGFDIGAARSRRLTEMPTAGTNTVLVSHLHGSIKKEEWLHLEMAEIIVFRPDGNGHAEPVARLRVGGWPALTKAMATNAATH